MTLQLLHSEFPYILYMRKIWFSFLSVWNLPPLAKLTDCMLVEVALLLIGLTHISFDQNRFWPLRKRSIVLQTASSRSGREVACSAMLPRLNNAFALARLIWVHIHAPSIIEGRKWFFQISSQWESQKIRFAFVSFGKIQFLPPCIWNLPFMSYCLWE